MASLTDMQNTIIEQLKRGEFVQGMEEFYAEDAVNEEASGAKTVGKRAIIENEKKILEGVAAFHGVTVHAAAAHDDGNGNGVTFMEYSVRVDLKDGGTFNPDQVQVTRWENGKAKHIRFYYDPAKL